MPKVTLVLHGGREDTVNAEVGVSLMESLRRAGAPGILALCGGCASCGTCHVHIAPEWIDKLPPRGEIEAEMLELLPQRTPQSRLTCQIEMSADLDELKLYMLDD
jgi:ferredoxin, 2Fe-2S